MSQQMVHGSRHDGSVTYTNRMSRDYAVVGIPGEGKWHKEKNRKANKQTRHKSAKREPKKAK